MAPRRRTRKKAEKEKKKEEEPVKDVEENPEEQETGEVFTATEVDELVAGDEDNDEDELEPPAKKAKTSSEEPKEPLQMPVMTREDKSLEEVLDMMDDEDFTPIIPDAVTDYYLAKSGFATSNRKIKRLLALATQKFVSDIATDAYEYSRIRSNTAVHNSSNPQSRARALMMATVMNSQGHSASDDAEDGTSNENPLSGSLGGTNQNQRVTLTIRDLSSALDEYGLNVDRPQFYR